MHKTAVVILNWNCLNHLKRFLGSVVRYSANSDTAIYVADNGSTDRSVEWISENFRDIRLIRMSKNNGFAEGYNIALKQIKAKYYVLLNADIEVTDRWLDPLISYLDENPDVASCQPKIRSFHNREFFEYGGAAGGFMDKYGFAFCRGRIFDVVEKDKGQYDNSIDIFWSSGACMAIRSDSWMKCNGFDGDFFAHMEEIDLCWRLHKMGYRVIFIPESVVYHVGGGTLPYDSNFKIYLNFRNNLFLLYKNLPEKSLKYILFVRKLFDGLAFLFFLLKGRAGSAKAVFGAHLDYYKNIRILREKRKLIQTKETPDLKNIIMNKSVVLEFYVKGVKTFKPWQT